MSEKKISEAEKETINQQDRSIQEKLFDIEVCNCDLGKRALGEAPGYVFVIVEFDLLSNNVPMQVAKKQLCLLTDRIDPVEEEFTITS